MKKILPEISVTWNSILVVAVLLSAFVIPVFPNEWGRLPVRLGFTLLFLSGVLSLEKRKRYLLYLSITAFVMEWISGLLDLDIIADTSKALNVIFFLMVVFYLIHQIATAKLVNLAVILQSISGYLLIGIIYSIVITSIIQLDPGAFNITQSGNVSRESTANLSQSMYFGLVTMSTVGYGDIVPLKPYSRSLATFISVSGQLYIAIIIALLVGKFASKEKD